MILVCVFMCVCKEIRGQGEFTTFLPLMGGWFNTTWKESPDRSETVIET